MSEVADSLTTDILGIFKGVQHGELINMINFMGGLLIVYFQACGMALSCDFAMPWS